LPSPAFCAISKQPELKHCAVRLEPAALPWRLRAMAWLPQDEALARRERLRPLLARLGYASCLPFGREPDAQGRLGLWLGAAAAAVPEPALLDALRAELALQADRVLDYRDPRTGLQRALKVTRDAQGAERLLGFWVAGTSARLDADLAAWWRDALQSDAPLALPARRMLVPGARAGAGAAPASPQLCSCFDVSLAAATGALRSASGDASQRLAQCQAALLCGTNCGSCLPRLRGLARDACDAASEVAT
jgi:assimilatory nitrate reductase catalytic subunit